MKTIEELWFDYKASCCLNGMSQEQVTDCMDSFYSGSIAVILTAGTSLNSQEELTEGLKAMLVEGRQFMLDRVDQLSKGKN